MKCCPHLPALLRRLNEAMCVGCLAQGLAHSKYSVIENGCSMVKNDHNTEFPLHHPQFPLCLLILCWTPSQALDLQYFISPSQRAGLTHRTRAALLGNTVGPQARLSLPHPGMGLLHAIQAPMATQPGNGPKTFPPKVLPSWQEKGCREGSRLLQ